MISLNILMTNIATVKVPFDVDNKEIDLKDLLNKVSIWCENMEDKIFTKMIEDGDKSQTIDKKEVISYIKDQL